MRSKHATPEIFLVLEYSDTQNMQLPSMVISTTIESSVNVGPAAKRRIDVSDDDKTTSGTRRL